MTVLYVPSLLDSGTPAREAEGRKSDGVHFSDDVHSSDDVHLGGGVHFRDG